MPLTANEKDELTQQVAALIELGEPEALVEAIRRACDRKARHALTPPEELKRWFIAANALTEALATVNAANSPESRKFAEHMAKWSGGTHEHREPDPGAPSSDRSPSEPPQPEKTKRERELERQVETLNVRARLSTRSSKRSPGPK